MKVKKIEHIGIAVKSIDNALKFYEGVLGLECYNIETVEDQMVKTAFLKVGEVKLELLESTSEDGPVAKFIAKRGEGIHHIAFNVDHVNNSLKEAGNKEIRMIDEVSRKGAEGFDIGFLHPKSTFGVLTEFCGHND
ncbi:MAG: methylmalonyl-CoA epimerase [Bacteroidia bacterium]